HVNSTQAASPGDIIINELMYNPDGQNEDLEYLELYNVTNDPVNLEDWCFTDGITLVTNNPSDASCFEDGTVVGANDYLIVSPNPAQTNATYGQTASASYAGTNLSNSGETVTLEDNTSTVIDSVTYDDGAPWPVTPDGDGPSLELKDPATDNSVAANWGASVGGPTPKAENSWLSLELPVINSVSDPEDITAVETVVISAELTNADSAALVFRVMFNAEQVVAMNDSGTSGDAVAGDDVFTAQIPAQAAGELVRFRVEASNTDGTVTSPADSDSVDYHGYVVQKDIDTELPVLQWFMDPSEYTDMMENHTHDDEKLPCVIAYGNEVFDNARVHIKGTTTRNLTQKAFAIDMPEGYKLQYGDMEREVDEFHLNSTYLDSTGIADVLSWRLAKEIGMPISQVFKTRLQQNGEFYGLYTFAEEYDKQWREEFGYQEGSFYKDNEKKNREEFDDGSEYDDWYNASAGDRSEERRDYILDNQDIPNHINFMAFEVFIRNGDWLKNRNSLSYHDIPDTGRWSVMPYDLDGAMFGGSAVVPGQNFVSPYEFPGAQGRFTRLWRSPFLAIYDEPDFRQVYYRRLRTLADQYLATGWYMDQYEDLMEKTEQDYQLNYEKWGALSDGPLQRQWLRGVIEEMELNYFHRFNNAWAVPDEQSANPVIDIQGVSNSTLNRDEDYIVIENNSAEAVDMSNWSIPELDFTFPLGAGLAPGQTGVVVRRDSVYRLSFSGSYVLGQLGDDIPASGTLTLNRADSSSSDIEVY
ncbi:CotH kinase family protein, partial [Candidatus Saccharibacteria bacterium]|nr:CotH kinase family protein [Candidatus Saccharibacteria bacterium]